MLSTGVTTPSPTTDQLGLALAQLNQKVQQITTQQAASASSTTTSSTPKSTTTTGWTEVNPPIQIISSGTAVGWTTIDLSSYIGSGVKRVTLTGYCKTSGSPDNVERELDFRANSGSATRIACRIIGVFGSYSGEQSFYLECPVSGQSIQYQINTTLQKCDVWLVETFS